MLKLISCTLFLFSGQRVLYQHKADSSSKSSSHSSKIFTKYISHVLEKLKNKQTRDSTTNNYLSIWRNLNKFLLNLDSKSLGSWEEKTALFGAYLVDNGIQSSTLKSYFSAIKHVLKLDGYNWDDNKVLLSSLVRGCSLVNDRVKTRLPIQKGLLEMLLFEIERKYNVKNPQPYFNGPLQINFLLGILWHVKSR